jgi:hypothetical protein
MHLNAIPKMIENLRRDWLINVAPIDRFRGGRLFDNETILRRAACASTSFDHDGTITGESSFTSGEGVFGEVSAREID